MPSQLLHTLFGEDVIIEIHRRVASRFGIVADKALEKIQSTHRKAFALGCQGPDVFYHSQVRRPVGLEYGTLLHRRGAGVFTAGLLKLGLPGTPADGLNAHGAYALGFMTHAILDRQTHPFIVYKSDRPPPETPRRDRSHAFLERIIDVLMLKHLRGAQITGWDQEGMLAEICENPSPGLKELLGRAMVLAYPERAGEDEKLSRRIENTFFDCAWFYRVTSPANTRAEYSASQLFPPQKGFVAYLYPQELPGHIDFLNLEKRPWYYPAGEAKEDFRSFPELYTGAVNAAADTLTVIITKYLEEGFFPIEEAAGLIGNGGLSIVDENGKPCAPCRSDPLPLQEILDQQIKMRGIGD